jgi:LysR family transcriptional regulator of gallate degradation
MAQADETHAALRGLRTDESLQLTVGVGTHLAGLILPQVVAGLLDELPRLAVHLRDGSGEELATALRRGEIDAAVCAWPADGVPRDVVFEELFRSDLVVVCRRVHPLARRRRVALEELGQRRWALAERPRAIGEVFRLAFTAAGLAVPDPVVRSTSLAFLLALLQETDLISLLPAGYVDAADPAGRLVHVRTALPPATGRIGILRRADDTAAAPALTTLVEALRAALRKNHKRRKALVEAPALR